MSWSMAFMHGLLLMGRSMAWPATAQSNPVRCDMMQHSCLSRGQDDVAWHGWTGRALQGELVPYAMTPKQTNKESLRAAVEAAAQVLNNAVRPVLIAGAKVQWSLLDSLKPVRVWLWHSAMPFWRLRTGQIACQCRVASNLVSWHVTASSLSGRYWAAICRVSRYTRCTSLPST